jgi:hypothetical protein
VTLSEHWAEGLQAFKSQLSTYSSVRESITAWGGKFPVGTKSQFSGTGNFSVGTQLANRVSSVKVEGSCCNVIGYTDEACTTTDPNISRIVSDTTQEYEGINPLKGVVTPGLHLKTFWGCQDCVKCIKVTKDLERYPENEDGEKVGSSSLLEEKEAASSEGGQKWWGWGFCTSHRRRVFTQR